MPSTLPAILAPVAAPHRLSQTGIDELIEHIVYHRRFSEAQITLLASHLDVVGSYDMTPLKVLMTKGAGMYNEEIATRTGIIARLRAALLASGADVPVSLVKHFYQHEAAAVAAASSDQKDDELSCPYTLCSITDAELVFLVSKEDDKQKRTIYPVSRQGFSEALLREARGKQQDESEVTPTIPTLSPPDNEAEALIIYANLPYDLQVKLKTAAAAGDASVALNQLFNKELQPHCSSYQDYLTHQHNIVKRLIATKVSTPSMALLHHLAQDFDALIPQLEQWRVEYSRDDKDIDEWATAWASFFDELIDFIQDQPKIFKHEAFMTLMSKPLEGGACAGTSLWYFIARDTEAREGLAEILNKEPELPILDAISKRITESEGDYDGTSALYYLAQDPLFITWLDAHADHLLEQASFCDAMSELMPEDSKEGRNMSAWTWAASVNSTPMITMLDQLLKTPGFINAMSTNISEDGEDLDCASGFSYLFMAETADRYAILNTLKQHSELLQNEKFLTMMEKDGWQALIGDDKYMRRLVANWAFKELDNALFCGLVAHDAFAITPPGNAASEEPEEFGESPLKKGRLDIAEQFAEWRENPILLPGVFGERAGRQTNGPRASSLPPSFGSQRSP